MKDIVETGITKELDIVDTGITNELDIVDTGITKLGNNIIIASIRQHVKQKSIKKTALLLKNACD